MMLVIQIVVVIMVINLVVGFIVSLLTIEPLQDYEKKAHAEVNKTDKK